MVELATGSQLAPGENLDERWPGASWTFLLPTMELGTVLVVGRASPDTLRTLTRLADAVVHAEPGDAGLAVADGGVDLAVVAGPGAAARFARDERLRAEVDRALRPGGRLYVQPGFQHDAADAGWVPAGVEAADLLWLRTRSGEVRAAAPLRDAEAIGYISRQVGYQRPSLTVRLVTRLRGRPRRRWRDEVALLTGGGRGAALRPPGYLVAAAAGAGLDVVSHRWGFVDHGAYSTKKLLVFLFRPGAPDPAYVVKLTRDPRFNPRLDNAREALTMLAERDLAPPGSAPRVAFAGEHAGLAFVAETAIDGTPLRDRVTAAAAPEVVAAVDWLVHLGSRSADATIATGPQVAASLREVADELAAVYRPPAALRAFLAAQIDVVAAHVGGVPLVLQHGDAGTWNVLVDRDGRPAFIDWEAAAPHGAPLWDLLYFVRSCAVTLARRDGVRDQLRAVDEHLFAVSPTSRLLADAVGRFRAATGLSRDLVEPLVHACWMQRAVKEAATLPPDRLDRSHYLALLRRGMERRTAPGLRLLFRA